MASGSITNVLSFFTFLPFCVPTLSVGLFLSAVSRYQCVYTAEVPELFLHSSIISLCSCLVGSFYGSLGVAFYSKTTFSYFLDLYDVIHICYNNIHIVPLLVVYNLFWFGSFLCLFEFRSIAGSSPASLRFLPTRLDLIRFDSSRPDE